MRTTTASELSVLGRTDRKYSFIIEIENDSGTLIELTDLQDYDWVNSISFSETVDQWIPRLEVRLHKYVKDARSASGAYNLAPLDEDSPLNVDDASAYAALVDANRQIVFKAATVKPRATPSAGDYKTLFVGTTEDPEWGGPEVVARARSELLADCYDRWIESPTVYGGTQSAETVIQDILTAETTLTPTLWVDTASGHAVPDKTMGPMRVSEAVLSLAQFPGFDLRERWRDSPGEFQLKFYQPNRTASSTDYDFSTDDLFDVRRLQILSSNVRNAITVGYTDSNGDRQTEVRTDSTSITRFGRKWMGMFLQADDPIDTLSEAQTLGDAALDDLKDPLADMEVEADFFWPAEVGDYYGFLATNSGDERWFSTTQELGVVGVRHEITVDKQRTVLSVRGKPAGQYLNWYPWGEGVRRPRERSQVPIRTRVTGVEIDFDENGEATVTATGDEFTANLYITVGDGTTPSDPTSGTNDGSISGSEGSVDTGVAITTGNQAIVKVVAADEAGKLGPVSTAKFSRRMGPFHKDSTDRNVTGTLTETTLETVTVPGGKLGTSGVARVTLFFEINSTNDAKTIRLSFGGANILTYGLAAADNQPIRMEVLISNVNSASSQDHIITALNTDTNSGSNKVFGGQATTSVDTSSNQDFEVTGQLDNTGDEIVLQFSMLEYLGTT